MATAAIAPGGKLMTADVDGGPAATDLEADDLDAGGHDAGGHEPDTEETEVDSNGKAAPGDDDQAPAATAERPSPAAAFGSARRWLLTAGVGIVVALAVLVGWLSYRTQHTSAAQHQRDLFVEVAKQSAVNLTTIDWHHADHDVDRILDNATGSFHDDFATQATSFIDIVKQSQSTTVGTVSEAGVESESGDSAQILVSVVVKTSNAAAPQQEPRSWRLRVGMQKTGPDIKVSNVEFVP